MRLIVVNNQLVEQQTLDFLNFLEVNYPAPQPVTVKFQKEPFVSFMDSPVVVGMCDNDTLLVSTAKNDQLKLLNTIAHEYRHAVQWFNGGNRDGKLFSVGNLTIRINAEEEDDAIHFADLAVAEFLHPLAHLPAQNPLKEDLS